MPSHVRLSLAALILIPFTGLALWWPAAGMAMAVRMAAWTEGGIAAAPSDTDQVMPVIAGDMAGGAYLIWNDYRDSWPFIYAQGVAGSGGIKSGWPAAGMALPVRGSVAGQVALADGAGGVFTATGGWNWYGHVLINHLGANGLAVPPWPADGVLIALMSGAEPNFAPGAGAGPRGVQGAGPGDIMPAIALDGQGGLLVAFTHVGHATQLVHVMRLTSSGDLTTGWPWNGATLSAGYESQWRATICADGAAGAIVAWQDEVAGIIAGHLSADGTIDSRWPVGGRVVADPVGPAEAPGLVSDDNAGCFVVWEQQDATGEAHPLVQHLIADGSVAAGWPVHGIALSQAPTIAGSLRRYDYYDYAYSSAVSDGSGGVIVAWTDMASGSGDVFAQHLLGNGQVAQGWPAGGLVLASGSADESLPNLCGDGAGGALVAWQSAAASESDVYIQHVNGAGVVASGWLATGFRVGAGVRASSHPVVTRDRAGGAIVAWEDRRLGFPNIYVQRIGTPPAAVTPETATLALERVRPDPAVGDLIVRFSLPFSASGTLDVLDVTGRLVRRADVGALGTGHHVINFGRGLSPGLYFIRLARAESAVNTRVVITR